MFAKAARRLLAAASGAVMVTCGVPAQTARQAEPVPWSYRADWSGGYTGWMSYPLSQDVGYDPSIYIGRHGQQAFLVHQFVAHGEPQAYFGMIRPLSFLADASSTIRMEYQLQVSGALRGSRVILVAADGHHYQAALPGSSGGHHIILHAAAFSLREPTRVVAVVLLGQIEKPIPGWSSRWVLRQFELTAKQPRQVALLSPQMDAAVDGSLVAREVVRVGGTLRITLAGARPAAHIELFDGRGQKIAGPPATVEGTQIAIPVARAAVPGLWRAEVVQGDAAASFRFLVLGGIPAHGHLLLTPERMAQLRGAPGNAGLRQEIHRRAASLASTINYSSAAGDNIALMPSGPGIEPAFPGQILPYMTLVEDYANAISYNALDFRLNGDLQSLKAARRALLAMAQWRTWSPPRFRQHGLNTYYEVGCVAQRVAFGYDLIADQLTAPERELVAMALRQQAIEPVVKGYFLYNRNPIAASNWMANSVGGALAAEVALAAESPDWQEQDGPALADLEFAFEQLLRGLFPGGGSEAEPAGYENFAMQGISWGMSALADLGIRPRGAHAAMQAFWWPDYATIRPGRQLDTGDFDGRLKALSGFAWGAQHSGDPAFRAFYDAGTDLDLLKGAAPDQNGHHLEELQGPLDLVCCTDSAFPLRKPPPSRVFPGRGSAVLRSGWGADSTVISLRVGPWFNHQHADEGTFQVAAFGRTLVSEAGYASYYTDPHYADYFSQAAGHNTVLLDSDPFSQGAIPSRFWPGFEYPHFTSTLLGASFDYLAADLAPAYEGRLARFQRQYLFLKPGILVIRDDLSAPEPHRFSWLLHPVPGANVAVRSGTASIALPAKAGNRQVGVTLQAAGANTAWKVVEAPIAVRQFSRLDGAPIPVPQELKLDSEPARKTAFLVGLRIASGDSSVRGALQAWHEPSGEGLQISGGGAAGVVFRTAAGLLQTAGLATDGSVLAWHGGSTPAGWLAAGATSVTRAGQPLLYATRPVTVEWESETAGVRLFIANSAATVIDLYAAAVSCEIQVDGRPAAARYSGNRLVLPELAPGQHRIRLLAIH